METPAVDLHNRRSRYVITNQEGKLTRKRTNSSTPEAFLPEFESLDSKRVRVAIGATGNWYCAADALEELELETHLEIRTRYV